MINFGDLFSDKSFDDFSNEKLREIRYEIQNYDIEIVLNTPAVRLVDDFREKHTMNMPVLKRGNKSRDPLKPVRESMQFIVYIPFEGDSTLLRFRPSEYMCGSGNRFTSIQIKNQEIEIFYDIRGDDGNDINEICERDIDSIESMLEFLSRDVESFNKNLPDFIKPEVKDRKSIAEKISSKMQSINIPIKKREDVPETYNIPEVRKKINITKKKSKTETFTPDPTLDREMYEDILTIVKNMSLVMERSPKTFAKLKEEEIRNLFLFSLNGHFEGNATGETFNGNGKTDIMIRCQEENAFIAECKIWRGQKNMLSAIDQLLGYVAWRDTKTAILLFSKKGDLTTVIEKARERIKNHTNYKSEIEFKDSKLEQSETVFGYKFSNQTDNKKEFFLTLMAFQIKS